MQIRYSIALGAMLAGPAFAAGLGVNVEIPRFNVAEYHRPYVAVWIEHADQTSPATLAVWYDIKTRGADSEGTKWLKDVRQWWRRAGRELTLPVDGVSSATRPAGRHQINVTEGTNALPRLPAGSYRLMVEAAREVGGREVVTIPFQWPPAKSEQLQAQGSSELGTVSLELKP